MEDMAKADAFSAPIPGESLTKPLGSAPYEAPPQIAELEEAAEYMFNTLTKNAKEIAMQLKAGLPAETIARTVLFSAFTKGVITPDIAGLISRIVLMQIVAIGQMMGVSGMKFTNKREGKQKRMQELAEFMMKNATDEKPAPTVSKEPEADVKLPKFMR